ncbi:MAG: hypothetical protein IPI77_16595 [Saprospiraceae bacterium]|nr:hypothetical protein [Saprospiraceae bacterium]
MISSRPGNLQTNGDPIILELKTARKYEVKIISTEGAPGFMIGTDDLSGVSALINSMKSLEEEKKRTDLPTIIITGNFD